MLGKRSLTILSRVIGAACVGVGALVLCAQIAEWWSFGDWNAVSVRYVLGYFNLLREPVTSSRYGLLDFPLNLLLIGGGILFALLGGNLPRRNAKTSTNNSQ